MNIQNDIIKRANEKLANLIKQAEEPQLPPMVDEPPMRMRQNPVLDQVKQLITNPVEPTGNALDAISNMSTGQGLMENLKGLGIQSNPLINALRSVGRNS